MPADDIRELTRALATTERAVLYGRVGVCVQEFGGLAGWLSYAINALTAHLDEPGGLMFTTPAEARAFSAGRERSFTGCS